MRFIRSWIERPLSTGAVTPSGKILARAMARYVDPNSTGPVVELVPGPGRSPRRWSKPASIRRGWCWSNSIRRSAGFCVRAIPRRRWWRATPTACVDCWKRCCIQPAAAVVSGLPLITKPIKMRLRLLRDAFDLMLPGAPFVQFTYSVASPVPRRPAAFRRKPPSGSG